MSERQTSSRQTRLPNHDRVSRETEGHETQSTRALRYVMAATRLALGWIFLWAFLDKTFGLGHRRPAPTPG